MKRFFSAMILCLAATSSGWTYGILSFDIGRLMYDRFDNEITSFIFLYEQGFAPHTAAAMKIGYRKDSVISQYLVGGGIVQYLFMDAPKGPYIHVNVAFSSYEALGSQIATALGGSARIGFQWVISMIAMRADIGLSASSTNFISGLSSYSKFDTGLTFSVGVGAQLFE